MINHEQQTYAQKVTVWCGITNERIIGPYFFEDNNRLSVTVTGHKYRKMIEEYLLLQIQDMQNFWFPRWGNGTYSKGKYDISWSFNFPLWPQRSPDLLISFFGAILTLYLLNSFFRDKDRLFSSTDS